MISTPSSDICIKNKEKHWNNGEVHYVIDDNVPEALVLCVENAMHKISRISSVKFMKKTNEKDYIRIIDENGYWSYVGKKGGEQKLSVTEGWPHPEGHIIHELMHALGFYHEHCRPDRDTYVIVEEGLENNFDYRRCEGSDVILFGGYDLESIMNYPLQVKQNIIGANNIGQRQYLSEGDKRALNLLYPGPFLRRRFSLPLFFLPPSLSPSLSLSLSSPLSLSLSLSPFPSFSPSLSISLSLSLDRNDE
uniref:Metalloendopeptidase n=1 Tax=Anthurium amnicola TaxID=1678845 RepID=A0A1D1YJP1_9ARAE